MGKKKLKATELYINRELSWLEFNDRVLREGLSDEVPLMERLKFLAIVSANLDEFFLVRVAGLMQQRSAGLRRRDPAGFTPVEQLTEISRRAHRMVDEQTDGIRAALAGMVEHGLRVFEPSDWTADQRKFLSVEFTRRILPVLTPLAMEELEPAPLLPGLQLHVAALVATGDEKHDGEHDGNDATTEKVVVVPVPTQFPRFVDMPSEEGTKLARLEDIIAQNIAAVVPGYRVLATGMFRITRDADVTIHDDDAGDLLQAVEEAVLARRRRAAVRLEISAEADGRIKRWLIDWLEVRSEDVYVVAGMLDARALMQIVAREGFADLRQADWPPQPPRDLIGSENLWQTLEDHDVMLFHPYESFDPVVRMLEEAADDPHVLAIKQTLYRTSGDSPVIGALERAAAGGKEVTVLVELKARFDEAQNVGWARRLEDAGCHVIYGIAGFKTHAKAVLIIRRQRQRIRRYVHLATGNYNDKTARLYSDIGLMTADRDMTADVATFFNLLTGYSEMVGWSKLAIAPTGLRQRFLDMIDREIQVSTPDQPGLIMAKVNSLEDPAICRALYEAAQGGVKVLLNVRGICCLRPGLKGVSENIEVCSIVDRFLEHARVFYFRNGGHEEVYLGSADWMCRNLSKRLEILFPVADPQLRKRLIWILGKCFADNMKSRRLLHDGSYEPVVRKGKRVRAQEEFYKAACEATRSADQVTTQFRPLTRPEQ